jgi:hypothetical protein
MRQLIRYLVLSAVVVTVFTFSPVRHAAAACVIGNFTASIFGSYTILLGHSYTERFNGSIIDQFVAGPADVGTFLSPPLGPTDTFTVTDNSVECSTVPTMSSWGLLALIILLAAVALSRLPARLTHNPGRDSPGPRS